MAKEEKKKELSAYEQFVKSYSKIREGVELGSRLKQNQVTQIPVEVANYAPDKDTQKETLKTLQEAEVISPRSQYEGEAKRILEGMLEVRENQTKGNFSSNLESIIDSTDKDTLQMIAMSVPKKTTVKADIDSMGEAYQEIRKIQEETSQLPENPYQAPKNLIEKMQEAVVKELGLNKLADEKGLSPDKRATLEAYAILLSSPIFVQSKYRSIKEKQAKKAAEIIKGKEKDYLKAVLDGETGYKIYSAVLNYKEQEKQQKAKQ